MLLLLAAPLWAQSGIPAQILKPLAEPRAAPALALEALDGREYGLADFEGRVILVNFWATWCPPCRKEMPALARLAQHFQGEAFEVVGVNVGESVERIQDFLQTLPVLPAFPMLLDPDGSVSQAWHARVVPTTLVVDRNGHLVLGAVGEVDFDSPDLRGQLQALIPGSGDAEGNGTAPAP
ncbi:TlpA disulfide reductase family protein [Thioalkalivibrio sp.]|uniref:TlpA family protein disulfide reductase n=1 Tax=Thioalkalivibrio sp. TaxID=2093813 RepID=UPI0025F94140|nr:TlpA disulfide reductase family protein [Thioalkalivibrio sp.]